MIGLLDVETAEGGGEECEAGGGLNIFDSISTALGGQLATGAIVLGLVAREHVLLVGPPGTAKSMLATGLTKAIDGAQCFNVLLTKYTTPEEVFGPPKLSALRKDNTGYDLRDLFIGAEGTLGVITAAACKLFSRPKSVVTAVVAIAEPHAAVALLSRLRSASGDSVATFELIPRPALELVEWYGRSPGLRMTS